MPVSILTQRFAIRSLTVGDRLLEYVTESIAPVAGSMLLGQSRAVLTRGRSKTKGVRSYSTERLLRAGSAVVLGRDEPILALELYRGHREGLPDSDGLGAGKRG